MNDNNSNNGAHERDNSVERLLDAYLMFQRNLPGEGLMEEPKTTDEIIDDLTPMMPLYGKKELVADYMLAHNYGFTTLADGTVKWAMWRLAEGGL